MNSLLSHEEWLKARDGWAGAMNECSLEARKGQGMDERMTKAIEGQGREEHLRQRDRQEGV